VFKLIDTEIEVKITFSTQNLLILIFCLRSSIGNSGRTIMYEAAYGTVPALIHLCLVKVVLVRNYLHVQTTSKFREPVVSLHNATRSSPVATAKSTPKNEEETELQKKKRGSQLMGDGGG
jgi:hypothetical protein